MLASLRANIAATLLGLLAAFLLAIVVKQSVELDGFLWIKGARDHLADCARDRAELRAITDERNRQKETTGRNMDTFREIIREVPTVIERAPNPADCGTPGLSESREIL